MKCPQCKTDSPNSTLFCGFCGTTLRPQKMSAPTETLQTPLGQLARGSLFANRYEIIEMLGRGGMGSVYRVFDKKITEDVAIKILKPEIAIEKTTIARFSNELKFARKITNKNVCKMYDLNEHEGNHFITMEYVPGEDLKSFIKRSGQVSLGKAVAITKQICLGLAEAHRLGVVHRDLKPSNIMIDEEGNSKIMDFGIARSTDTKGITEAGMIVGTPEYMSPEQVEGDEVDTRSDIYSLGVIFYELVTGNAPFIGKTPISIAFKHKTDIPQEPSELNTQVNDKLSRIILKCLDKDREKRYQSAEDLFEDLKISADEIPTTSQLNPQKRSETTIETRASFSLKTLLLPPAIILGVLAVVFILGWIFSGKDPVLADDEFTNGAVVLEGNITPPEILFKLDPIYPEQAREKGTSGVVTLKVRVNEQGLVEAVKLLFSIPLLDQAAIDAVKQWKFDPKIINNEAVPVVFSVKVPFKLE